jgi:hypothetical protein
MVNTRTVTFPAALIDSSDEAKTRSPLSCLDQWSNDATVAIVGNGVITLKVTATQHDTEYAVGFLQVMLHIRIRRIDTLNRGPHAGDWGG